MRYIQGQSYDLIQRYNFIVMYVIFIHSIFLILGISGEKMHVKIKSIFSVFVALSSQVRIASECGHACLLDFIAKHVNSNKITFPENMVGKTASFKSVSEFG